MTPAQLAEALKEFRERGPAKAAEELLFTKGCICHDPEEDLCPYRDDSYDVEFGARFIHDALAPLLQCAVEALNLICSGELRDENAEDDYGYHFEKVACFAVAQIKSALVASSESEQK